MKKGQNLFITAISLISLFYLISCGKDFLERTPEDSYVEDNYYTTDDALEAATSPLYTRAWFEYHTNSVIYIGSTRANDAFNPWVYPEFTTFQVTALHDGLTYAWKGLYSVVTMANSVIDAVNTKATADVSESAKETAKGEARLMRGIAYFYMLRLWGPVILFEDNQEIVDNPIRPVNPEEDVFKFIINDLTYAAEHLPESGAASGRATSWSAKAMLAKVYLARSGWNSDTRDAADLEKACDYAADVCDNSGLNLLSKYENLFKYKYNNNEESLLAMQWVPLGEWYVCNTLYSELTFSSDISGGVNVWGAPYGTYDQILQYEQNDTLRLNASFFTQGTYYSYINMADGGYTYTGDMAPNKKGAIGGPDDDNDGKVAVMNSPLNTYIIRLADVYLTYAEACLGNSSSLSSGPGLDYFNRVRERAGLETKTSITFEDIIRERRCEFAMEYTNWYDMVTWYKWKPEYMLEYLNSQDRPIRAKVVRENGVRVVSKYDDGSSYNVTITNDNIFFPYPESDVIQNPMLKEDPQPYDFNE